MFGFSGVAVYGKSAMSDSGKGEDATCYGINTVDFLISSIVFNVSQ